MDIHWSDEKMGTNHLLSKEEYYFLVANYNFIIENHKFPANSPFTSKQKRANYKRKIINNEIKVQYNSLYKKNAIEYYVKYPNENGIRKNIHDWNENDFTYHKTIEIQWLLMVHQDNYLQYIKEEHNNSNHLGREHTLLELGKFSLFFFLDRKELLMLILNHVQYVCRRILHPLNNHIKQYLPLHLEIGLLWTIHFYHKTHLDTAVS